MTYVTYVLKNDVDKIYIGHTVDLQKRLSRHNGHLSTKKDAYTSKNRNGTWRVVHCETFETRSEAMKRERELKSSRGRTWIRHLLDTEKLL